uniref:BRISC and BRCA1-A complex member 1 isoform X2 n=1 Tax=Ciona intestinalis TaxID=7719 RepID=UPI000180B788|nr:BRISC and BRCA1-A complex member 1 isoform X2 [Ciona intestinalis]XP_018669510.1 BRISC and BRCA1-A complex member 1 isoform X1 [Ciona intestinalis]|eukprot:XP_002126178.1 BRISC and BRCA1-A complex member 1 isoform X2 [Ciona intestinalis]
MNEKPVETDKTQLQETTNPRRPVEHSTNENEQTVKPVEIPNETETKPIVKQKLYRKPSVKRKCVTPKVNCPEKIILCIDHSAIMFTNKFKRTVQSMKQQAVFQVLTGAVRNFIKTKSFIDSRHQFALVLLNQTPQLIVDFQPSGQDVMFMLKDIGTQFNESEMVEVDDEVFNLSTLFDQVENMVNLPSVKHPDKPGPPPYVVRMIFVFGRSSSALKFCENDESFQKLNSNPYFFCDCVYIHEEPNDGNCVTDNFMQVCELDKNGTSFIYEVGTDGSMSSLYNAFANLLAHPLQRQRDINVNNHDILLSPE